MIETEKIITLDNDKNYIVAEKTTYAEVNYFRAVLLNNDYTLTKTDVIFKEIGSGESMSVEEVLPGQMYDILENIFDEMLFKTHEENLLLEEAELVSKVADLEKESLD